MLFSSQEFIFGFLPLAVVGFFAFGLISRSWALVWLIAASLLFYAWWRPANVLIIAPSVLINFVLARILLHLGDDERFRLAARTLLLAGIAFNVAFLGYFKYINFARSAINDVFATDLVLTQVILPLGISFITFQKIAFLFDVHAGRIKSVGFRDFSLFVLFFPQLIAGPIVHYREMMPQFQSLRCCFDSKNISVGLTLFVLGLFKKIVLADGIAQHVSPIYDHAADGNSVSFALAWLAAVGFTLQIYFDFSGYSDMAIGIARMFGIKLPPNFFSPLRASNIIDFWLRWHMTLTRFLTAYIYNPLSLWLTRRRLSRGQTAFGGRNTTLGSFLVLLVFPTMLTMFVSGLWHGASYLFVVWGLLHGLFISINHGWRVISGRLWPKPESYPRLMVPVGFVLTFISVVTAMIFFRSPTWSAAINLVAGMAGLHGLALPEGILQGLGPLGRALQSLGISPEQWSGRSFMSLTVGTAILLFIALACPNTLQIMARYEPALGIGKPASTVEANDLLWQWSPSLAWAMGISLVAAIAVLHLSGPSEFLYWQF